MQVLSVPGSVENNDDPHFSLVGSKNSIDCKYITSIQPSSPSDLFARTYNIPSFQSFQVVHVGLRNVPLPHRHKSTTSCATNNDAAVEYHFTKKYTKIKRRNLHQQFYSYNNNNNNNNTYDYMYQEYSDYDISSIENPQSDNE